jgi:hypothetical protein
VAQRGRVGLLGPQQRREGSTRVGRSASSARTLSLRKQVIWGMMRDFARLVSSPKGFVNRAEGFSPTASVLRQQAAPPG